MQSTVAATSGPRVSFVQPKLLVSIAVVLLAVVYLVTTGTRTSSVYYLTVSELKANGSGGKPVRLAGKVEPGSIQRDNANTLVRFDVQDAGGALPVIYSGVVPDIFGDDIEVVVEGTYGGDGVFHAASMLAKCPSKFEAKLQAS